MKKILNICLNLQEKRNNENANRYLWVACFKKKNL